MTRRMLGVLMGGLLVLLAACGGAAPRPVSPSYSPHNDADVMFAQMMIPHHEQAVQLSDVLLRSGDIDTPVADLATRIKDAQTPEIAQMRGWLVVWGENPSPSPSGTAHGDGMTSAAEVEALERATGAQAQRLYLQGMIRHHQGAVAMAQDEVADGQSLEAKALARTIVTSQQAEITEMQQLLGG